MSSSMKSLFLDSNYDKGIKIPKVVWENYPSKYSVNKQRRKVPFANRAANCSLYLTAADMPSEKSQELAEIPETSNKDKIELPHILESLTNVEKSINEKLTSLQKLGTEGYFENMLKESLENRDRSHGNVVDGPGNHQNPSASVVATNETKVKKRKNTKSQMTIMDHSEKKRKT